LIRVDAAIVPGRRELPPVAVDTAPKASKSVTVE
jgi:hypothetical protein